jgi:hypothetical protein
MKKASGTVVLVIVKMEPIGSEGEIGRQSLVQAGERHAFDP